VSGKYPLTRKIDDTSLARRYAPKSLKTAVTRTRLAYGRVTAERCVLPTFVIFGAQRCGTTSLYKALTCHPYVIPARVKEVHYFDKHFDEQSIWYRSHFPNRWALEPTRQHRVHKITGEATPDYMYYEEVPARVRDLLPDVRLVAILRDPAARAYSHYQHEVALGFETLGFREALEHEGERLATGRWFEREHHSYRERGLYAVQLRRWLEEFPPEQVAVVDSESFYEDGGSVYRRVLEHIGLPVVAPHDYPRRNGLRYDPLDPDVEADLRRFYGPHNEELFELLGRRFRWEA